MTSIGAWIGRHDGLKRTIGYSFAGKDKTIDQVILGIKFKSPIGLSAGFDYEAKLTQITPALGLVFIASEQ